MRLSFSFRYVKVKSYFANQSQNLRSCLSERALFFKSRTLENEEFSIFMRK